MAVVVLDAGHGGSDLGATYQGRQEKDDTLALTLAVGRLLAEDPDIDVVYTRETDVYDTPLVKAPESKCGKCRLFCLHPPQFHTCSKHLLRCGNTRLQ